MSDKHQRAVQPARVLTPQVTRWVATAVHADGLQLEAEISQEDMPLLQDFAAALLVQVAALDLRPRRGSARPRSKLRMLKDYGFSIDGIRELGP
jgi:hypothetical protein